MILSVDDNKRVYLTPVSETEKWFLTNLGIKASVSSEVITQEAVPTKGQTYCADLKIHID